MKFRIISPDAKDRIDCVLRVQMLNYMQDVPDGMPFVPISYFPNYIFNSELLKLKSGSWVLCDMTEYGWDWDMVKNNVLGRGVTRNYTHIADDEWAKLDDFVRECPPLIHFKRELKATDQSPTLMPMEHLCWLPAEPVQSKAEFDARRIEVLHIWGWSHPSRALLHGEIFKAMADGIGVISDIDQLEGYFKSPSRRTWASMYAPWYCRIPMPEILQWTRRSKLFVSLHGAGHKCFRMGECISAVHALQEDLLAWSYEWTHGVNCVRLRVGDEFNSLDEATRRDDLHEIHLGTQATLEKYRGANYVRDYMIPTIEALM